MTLNGIPIHPLLVHFEVVIVLVTAILAIVTALWPAARRRIGSFAPACGVVALILTPLTTSAGEDLAATTSDPNSILASHMRLGDQMIWWVLPLFVVMTALWSMRAIPRLRHHSSTNPALFHSVSVSLTAVSVVLALGALVWLYRIGDSGAQSVWLQ